MAAKRHFPIGLKELIGLEGAIWLIVGLIFGYFGGKGGALFVVAVPIAVFLVWALDFVLGCGCIHKR